MSTKTPSTRAILLKTAARHFASHLAVGVIFIGAELILFSAGAVALAGESQSQFWSWLIFAMMIIVIASYLLWAVKNDIKYYHIIANINGHDILTVGKSSNLIHQTRTPFFCKIPIISGVYVVRLILKRILLGSTS